MQRNSRLAILIVFVIIAVFVWLPRGKATRYASPAILSAISDHGISVAGAVPRKRTEFIDWGRNPFAWTQGKQEAGGLTLHAVIYGDEGAHAAINESIVCVGDNMADKTVKRIEPNRVILTDGTKDYILVLQE